MSIVAGEMVPFEAGTLVILVQRLQRTGQPKQIMAQQYIPELRLAILSAMAQSSSDAFRRSHAVRRLVCR
jgi:hypothetical protein